MIPVVGIYAFGWSAALAVFNYWFYGLTALTAIVAAMIPRALRETQPKTGSRDLAGNVVRGVVMWLLLVGIVGSAVLDRVDSAARPVARRRVAPPARAFSGALVHVRLARIEPFLEGRSAWATTRCLTRN